MKHNNTTRQTYKNPFKRPVNPKKKELPKAPVNNKNVNNKNSMHRVFQILPNYLPGESLITLMKTSQEFRSQLKNSVKVIEFIYTEIKKAFFFRAFVLEFLHLWEGEVEGDLLNLLNKVYSGEIANMDKLERLDKTLTNIIVNGVKEIKDETLLELLRKDPHFKSNPKAVFDTLKFKTSQNERNVSGKRTLHIVRSMLGGEKPISYLNLNKWTFKLNSPIAKIVNLDNQNFQTFLRPHNNTVTNKSVKDFLKNIKLKNTNVQNILMNNIGVYTGSRPNLNTLPQGNRVPTINRTPRNNNNTSSLNEIRKALGLSRNQIAKFISKQYPGFNQNKNVVPREGFMSSNQNKKAHAAKAAREKGKGPKWLNPNINYSNYRI
tara:strand:+ start:2626 stop:3756 length:1131 start_codon:yes stop_codon:yes gene_type:complete